MSTLRSRSYLQSIRFVSLVECRVVRAIRMHARARIHTHTHTHKPTTRSRSISVTLKSAPSDENGVALEIRIFVALIQSNKSYLAGARHSHYVCRVKNARPKFLARGETQEGINSKNLRDDRSVCLVSPITTRSVHSPRTGSIGFGLLTIMGFRTGSILRTATARLTASQSWPTCRYVCSATLQTISNSVGYVLPENI